MKNIIEVAHISKSYTLFHQDGFSYRSLRDEIMDLVKKPQAFFRNKNTSEKFWALNDISFNIKKGESVGIIGANGAGKSTLLKILSRITLPTKGEVKLFGRVSSILEVGTGFHPELTGRENIYLSGAILGMKKQEIQRKFDDIVSFAEVENFLDTPVKHYSSGMFVKLAFSVASHLEPDILLIDEVLAVGDARFQKKSLGRMESLGKSGRTILFVSHNLAAIRAFCTRAIHISEGKIVFDGSVPETIEHYLADLHINKTIKKWENSTYAPKNRSCIVHEVALLTENGNAVNQITTDDSFVVSITFETLIDQAFAGFLLQFYDNENRCIFQTINNHEKRWYGKSMPKGTYKSICHIPGNFFNNGTITLRFILFEANFSDAYITNDILHFEVLDGIEVRNDYYGQFDGVVRPLFLWDTIKE